MFFVGVQLDITAPPTPKAGPSAPQPSQSRFAPSEATAVGDSQEAAAGGSGAHGSDGNLQPAVLPSPAASPEVQAQVRLKLFLWQVICLQSGCNSEKVHACIVWLGFSSISC